MTAPPSLTELQTVAASALAGLGDADGQATVVWERVRDAEGERDTLTATFTVVADGRAATATADPRDEARLARAAKSAVVNARRPRAWPAPPLPDPLPGRTHEGWDPAALGWTPPADGLDWTATAHRIAIASTRGVRAAEQRTHVRVSAGPAAQAAAVGPGALDLDALRAEAEALASAGDERAAPPSGGPIVLGPVAVAALLDQLRPAFGVYQDVDGGPLAGRAGTRVAAPAINLSDSARYPGTLPRSFDAEGVPRQPVPLIQDGVAHRRVHDSASAARHGATSTGHASRAAALAAMPEHLVLVGGGAEGVDELVAPVAEGLYVPALARGADGRLRAVSPVAIAGGRLGWPVRDHAVDADPLEVLATVEALGSRQRLVALPGHCPGGAGAAMVPPLRARAGLRS